MLSQIGNRPAWSPLSFSLPFREGSGVGSKAKSFGLDVLRIAWFFVLLPKISCCYGFGILYLSVLVQVVQDWA